MKTLKYFNINILKACKSVLFIPLLVLFLACSNDDDSFARVMVNGTILIEDVSDFNGDIDASFTGNNGTTIRSFIWNNNLSTADYNADITATSEGSFRIVVEDSEGIVVLDSSIQGSREPDSIDGVTSAGTPGIWTVSIELSSFTGDGSFSLSEGD